VTEALYARLRDEPALWEHFTRKEEYSPRLHDQFGRFPYYLSNCREIRDPVCSRYLLEQGYMPEYPDGHEFAVCLTHDIDSVYQSILSKGFSALKAMKGGRPSDALSEVSAMRNRRLPLWNFDEIMDLEEEYGAKSSFYFLALRSGDQDYSYDIEDLEDVLGRITDHGCEVGLHGGHEACQSFEKLSEEKRRLEAVLGRKVLGYRNHYLRFRVPDTWENLSQAGFMYDTTLGYADCAGFRNGMCHPFSPYNLETGKAVGIVEIPLTVMDCTLFATYMRLDTEAAMRVVRRLIDTTAECRGVFTLLWHNSYLVEGSPEQRMYRRILEYCSEKGAWMTSGEEIAEWWGK